MDKAVADGLVVRPGPLTRDPANEKGHYAPSGVFGDATLASWRKGQVVVEAQVADILKDLDALAGEPIPPGEPGSPLGR
jgi:creatinine amidohydrolase/Fe(II)-dependent formamide hydrolase-like protein